MNRRIQTPDGVVTVTSDGRFFRTESDFWWRVIVPPDEAHPLYRRGTAHYRAAIRFIAAHSTFEESARERN